MGTGSQLALLALSLVPTAITSVCSGLALNLAWWAISGWQIARKALTSHCYFSCSLAMSKACWREWPPQSLGLILCAGTLFTERGTIVTVFIIFYALTSFVAGYVRCGFTA